MNSDSQMKDETGSLHLKVITYNVHRCNPPSKIKENLIDVEAVIQVLKRQNADVVFLQEVDVYTARSGKGLNEAEAVAKGLNMYWSFGKAIDLQGGAYGVAILSKFPLQKEETVLLPKSPEKNIEQRVLLTVTATLSGNKQIQLACTHMDHVKETDRLLQTNKINEIFSQSSLPVVLGGDFNDIPSSAVLKSFQTVFNLTCTGCLPTFPNDMPEKTIDYVLTDRKTKWKVLSYTVPDEQFASDHRPVAVLLQF